MPVVVVLRGKFSNSAPSALLRVLSAYKRLNLYQSTTDNTGRTEASSLPRVIRLSVAQKEQMVESYLAGATVYQLAAEYGINRRTVSKYLKAAGITLRCGPLSDAEVARAIELYDTGLSISAVGRELGRDHAGIWRALHAAGVQMRDSHGRERKGR